MKKRSRHPLLLALYLSLIAMTVSSISVSAAWFTAYNRLFVAPVEIQVKTDRTLLVSTSDDLSSFQENIDFSDLGDSSVFLPVTSMFSKSTFLDEKGDTPVFLSSYLALTPIDGVPYTPKPATGGYFSQVFYLYADDDIYVTLSSEETTFEANHAKNVSVAKEKLASTARDEEVEAYAANMDKLVDALRLSILDPDKESYSYTILDPNKKENEDTLFGGRLDLVKSGFYNYYVGTDGEKYETVYGDVKNRDKILYDSDVHEEDSPVNGSLSSFNAATKAGVHAYREEESLANGVSYASEGAISLEEYEKSQDHWISLTRHKPKKIVVSLYLEGWDRDCLNETMGASFFSKLSFKIARER